MLQYEHIPLDRRLQVLLDERQHRRVAAVARERGVSVATVVREAIERGLAAPESDRRAAGRRLLDAPDMAVPGAEGLREELEALRGRRA